MLVKAYLHKVNGEIMHPKSVVAKYGTTKANELKKIDVNYEKVEMKKKHRYLFILTKSDRKKIINELKHSLDEYPKNNNNCDW